MTIKKHYTELQDAQGRIYINVINLIDNTYWFGMPAWADNDEWTLITKEQAHDLERTLYDAFAWSVTGHTSKVYFDPETGESWCEYSGQRFDKVYPRPSRIHKNAKVLVAYKPREAKHCWCNAQNVRHQMIFLMMDRAINVVA